MEDEQSEGAEGDRDDDDLLAAAVAAVEAEETTGNKVKKLFRKRKPPAAPSALQIPLPVKTFLHVERRSNGTAPAHNHDSGQVAYRSSGVHIVAMAVS